MVKMEKSQPLLSIVIPIYNEEDSLPELYRRLCSSLSIAEIADYEIIFVSDASTDMSMKIILALHKADPRVKVIELSRNFGHQMAQTAGIDHATGKAVILMDGDLQDPPEILTGMIEKWKGGWDVVYGVRKSRQEGISKRVMYKLFYRILHYVSNINIPIDSGDFALMDRKIIDLFKAMPERSRFIRGLRAWVGFKQTPLEYERDKRFAGDVKYTWYKLTKLAIDGMLSFSTLPLKIVSFIGFLVSVLSFLGIATVLYLRLFTDRAIPGWTATVIPVLFLSGIQLLSVGILGEYIARIFDEVKQRPHYIIKDKKGFDV